MTMRKQRFTTKVGAARCIRKARPIVVAGAIYNRKERSTIEERTTHECGSCESEKGRSVLQQWESTSGGGLIATSLVTRVLDPGSG